MENNIFSKMPVNWTVCMQADSPSTRDACTTGSSPVKSMLLRRVPHVGHAIRT